jgi:cysteine desulfurase
MLPYFGQKFGNAASRTHHFGWEAEQAVERARRQIASLARVSPRKVVFTSGATESNNLGLKGVLEAPHRKGHHIISQVTEHSAILDVLRRVQKSGAEVTLLPVGADGLLDPDEVRRAIRPQTILVSIMAANNEIGVIQPIAEIAVMCRERGVLFHTDAAQAFGKVKIAPDIDLISVTAHKMYGPKGCGALIVGHGVRLVPQMDGGGHERGLRSGTLNVPAIVGLGEACAICTREMEAESSRVGALRDRLRKQIIAEVEDAQVNGSIEHRLVGNLNLCFPGVNASALLTELPDVAISSGSACSSATPEPSHVLRALGLNEQTARSSVRFGLGRFNTEEEVDYVAGRVIQAVRKLRALSPVVA